MIRDADDVFFLTTDEVAEVLNGPDAQDLVTRRRAEYERARRSTPASAYGAEQPPPPLEIVPEPNRWQLTAVAWTVAQIFAQAHSGARAGDDVLTGIPASPGRYTGTARVVMDESQFDRIQAGDVLVCPVTSPVWSILFSRIGALVTDVGGTLSHPAIIAREFGIPAVVATGNGTTFVGDGDRVEVDGVSGAVRILSRSPEGAPLLAAARDLSEG
jgi:pyruvate,water dikinase